MKLPKPDPRVFETTVSCQNDSNETLPSITPSELVNRINEPDSDIIVVDCRSVIEHTAGRIIRARSLTTYEDLVKLYETTNPHASIVFHCEFSSIRGPKWRDQFRRLDRKRSPYPFLKYNNIYLLSGGYKAFYNEFPQFCNGNYLSLEDPKISPATRIRINREFKEQIARSTDETCYFQPKCARSAVSAPIVYPNFHFI